MGLKEKHVIREHALYLIQWQRSYFFPGELKMHTDHFMDNAICHSVGWHMGQDKRYIYLSGNYTTEYNTPGSQIAEPTATGIIAIPKKSIIHKKLIHVVKSK